MAKKKAAAKKTTASKGLTHYSTLFPGDAGNYQWSARVDVSDRGYIGINQKDGETWGDRVLLTKRQFQQIVAFVRKAASR